MKCKSFKAVFYILCLFFVTACFDDNCGYPEKIIFDRDGGKKYTKGDAYALCIYEGEELVACENYDKKNVYDYSVSYEWLSAKIIFYAKDYSKMEIAVAPNESGKRRELKLSFMVFDSGADIKIIQNK